MTETPPIAAVSDAVTQKKNEPEPTECIGCGDEVPVGSDGYCLACGRPEERHAGGCRCEDCADDRAYACGYGMEDK